MVKFASSCSPPRDSWIIYTLPAFSCTWPTFYAALSRKSYGEKSARLSDDTRGKRKSVSQLINCAGGHDEPIEWATIGWHWHSAGEGRKVCHISENWNPIKWLLKISSCDIKTFPEQTTGASHMCNSFSHRANESKSERGRNSCYLNDWAERSKCCVTKMMAIFSWTFPATSSQFRC